ncbi:ABC transporter permease [Sulfurisoma sediminicola]|uniref:Transport permease protein n=1 Tax=Sulfurisoma sediminicola TaxID=1381557 RepID=A0A497XKT9_9PROT|nr:ABC transporter permease [Sulfurisoma sediminicola]RLJ68010.1 lipopolysaccharide transport system permease protein [Sulfurisoma sediminicola]
MSESYRVVEPQTGVRIGFGDVWQRRELLGMLFQRQIAARYRQMLLGVVWLALEPMAQLAMLTIVFGFLLRVDTGGYPYPLFAFSAMTGWWLFSKTLMSVAGSLQDNIGLISKVYFPRLILPLAATMKELFDGGVMVVILVGLSMLYGYLPTAKIVVLVPLFAYAALIGLGVGLWIATVMVRFRDVRPMMGLVLQAGMYATPIVYPATLVPERFAYAYQFNPMYWVVELSRWALMDKPVDIAPPFFWSLGFVCVTVYGGLMVFAKTEKIVVDVQ